MWKISVKIALITLMLCAGLLGISGLNNGMMGTETAEAGRTRLVLGFYYAWYDPTAFGAGKMPFQPQYPYYSTSSQTMRRQVKMAKAAGLDGFIQSWYGNNQNQQTEPNFQQLLDISQEQGFKATVHFESVSPFFNGNQDRINSLKTLIHTHAKHPAFLRMDGKPVIFFWANWALSVSDWQAIRNQVDPHHTTIWMGEGGHTNYLSVFDGLHLYNVAWSANPGGVNQRWANETRSYGEFRYWAGTAMPGFDNSRVPGVEHTVRGRNNGAYLRDSFQGAAASDPDLMLVTSFNEWAEGSALEPSTSWGNSYLNIMRELSAGYKGVSSGSFPAIPAWLPPATPTPPPSFTPVTPIHTATPWPTNTPIRTWTPAATHTPRPTITPIKTWTPVATWTERPTRTPANTSTPWPTNTIRPRRSTATAIPATITVIPTRTSRPIPAANISNLNASIGNPRSRSAERSTRPISTPPVAEIAQTNDGYLVYTVQPGDTLSTIALRYGFDADELRDLNNLDAADTLVDGQRLILGVVGDPQPTATPVPARPTVSALIPTPQADGSILYTVPTQEVVSRIAQRFGVPFTEILTLNGLSGDAIAQPGSRLLLGYAGANGQVVFTPPQSTTLPDVPIETVAPENLAPPTATAASNKMPTPQPDGNIIYQVQENESVYSIAAKFDLSARELLRLNGLTEESILILGAPFLLGKVDPRADTPVPMPLDTDIEPIDPADPSQDASQQPTVTTPEQFAGATMNDDGTFVHTVTAGDTAIGLAIQYGYESMDAFYEVSGLSENSVLSLGDQLIVGSIPVPQSVGGSTDDGPPTVPPPTITPIVPPTQQIVTTPTNRPTAIAIVISAPTQQLPLPTATTQANQANQAGEPIVIGRPTTVLVDDPDLSQGELNDVSTPVIEVSDPGDANDVNTEDGQVEGQFAGSPLAAAFLGMLATLLAVGLVIGYLRISRSDP